MIGSVIAWLAAQTLTLAGMADLSEAASNRLARSGRLAASAARLTVGDVVLFDVRRIDVHTDGVLFRVAVANLSRRVVIASAEELWAAAGRVRLQSPGGPVWRPDWPPRVPPGAFPPSTRGWHDLPQMPIPPGSRREFLMRESAGWAEDAAGDPPPRGAIRSALAFEWRFHCEEPSGRPRTLPLWVLGFSDSQVAITGRPVPAAVRQRLDRVGVAGVIALP